MNHCFIVISGLLCFWVISHVYAERTYADGFPNDLSGILVSTCFQEGDEYFINRFWHWRDHGPIHFIERYEDDRCSKKLYTVQLGDGTTTIFDVSDQSYNNVNFTWNYIILTPEDDDMASMFNEEKICGFDDWESGQKKHILGTDCLGAEWKPVYYDIFESLYCGSMRIVYFGETTQDLNGSSENQRPEQINWKVPYLAY